MKYVASVNLKEHISKKNDEGKTALMLASEGGHDETVRVLRQLERIDDSLS